MSNITNIPSAQTLALQTSSNLAKSLVKEYSNADLHSFITNGAYTRGYQEAIGRGSTVKVDIKPVHNNPTPATSINDNAGMGLTDFQRYHYGKIDLKLDYSLSDNFRFHSSDIIMIDGVAGINADVEADNLTSSVQVLLRGMKQEVNRRLIISAAATDFGTTGTALNANVFRKVRTTARNQGHANKVIECRMSPETFEIATQIPEFQNIGGFVPTVGNNNFENSSINPNRFEVRGFFNMVFISDDTYIRPTPLTDPIISCYIDISAAVPMRGLPVMDSQDRPIFFRGVNMLYQKSPAIKINGGGKAIPCSLEFLFGFKELSGVINQTGVIQNYPLWNILGGQA